MMWVKMGFIQTTIHYALQHEELKDDLLRYMKELVDSEVARAGL